MEREFISILQTKKPQHIGVILKQLFHDREWEFHRQVALLLLRWEELVGPKIASQSQPEFLQEDVLQVRVENSVWLSHLRFLEEELRQRINEKLSSHTIKGLRFRQGPLNFDKPQLSTTNEEAKQSSLPQAKPLPPLSPEQQQLLEKIPDLDLRRDLEALLRKL